MMADKKNPLGPTGRTVAENVRQLRERQNLTYAELGRRLEAAGRPIPTLGLRKIESFERRVDSDDLVALALAFDVSPIALLMPEAHSESDCVQMTGVGDVTASDLWAFLSGYRSPRGGGLDFAFRSLPVHQQAIASGQWNRRDGLEFERRVRTDGENVQWQNMIGRLGPFDGDNDGDDQ